MHGLYAVARDALDGRDAFKLLGELVHDRYVLLQVLGQGGMGSVYLANDLNLSRDVALKITFVTGHQSAALIKKRFHREAQATGRLNHPNVVQAYEWGQTALADGRKLCFLALQLLTGETLENRLFQVQKLTLDQTLRIARDVALGLDAAHSLHVIHRDLKPANVFLHRPQGQKGALQGGPGGKHAIEKAILTDFGIARLDGETLTETQQNVAGTVEYIAPEQWAAGRLDYRCDLWALGVIVYQCLAGNPPFVCASPPDGPLPMQALLGFGTAVQKQPVPPLPRDDSGLPWDRLDAVMTHALAKSPADRFQSAADFVRALTEAAGGPPETVALLMSETPATGTPITTLASSRAPAPRPPVPIAEGDDEESERTVASAPSPLLESFEMGPPIDANALDAPTNEFDSAIRPLARGRRRRLIWGAVGVGILAVAGGIALYIRSNREEFAGRAVAEPAGMSEGLTPASAKAIGPERTAPV